MQTHISRIGSTNEVYAKLFVFLFPLVFGGGGEHALQCEVPSRLFALCNLFVPPRLNRFVRLFLKSKADSSAVYPTAWSPCQIYYPRRTEGKLIAN